MTSIDISHVFKRLNGKVRFEITSISETERPLNESPLSLLGFWFGFGNCVGINI